MRCRSMCRWSTCTPSAPAAARSPAVDRAGHAAGRAGKRRREPGPICYGRGGTRPTITDANLVLGRLDPDRLLARRARGLAWTRCAPRCSRATSARRSASMPTRRRGGDRARRQRPDGRRDPHGVAVARPRSARFRAVRVRRRRAAARGRAGARARHPGRAGSGAARPDQRARLPRRRPAPRLRQHRQPAARGARRWRASREVLAAQIARTGQRADREARSVAVERVVGAAFAPTCSSRARATSCRSRSTRRADHRRRAAEAVRRCLLAALRGRAARDPRRCWSTCTPR